tara:strand:+ start:3712 stop:5514 length:1803 start_codon:yes stop_codon:yes gene_type:complete
MAEVAIPIAVLGAMYIISNKNENKKENYSNIKQSLANTKPIVKNFPKKTFDDLLNETNVQTYSGYKNGNEELYKPTGYKNALRQQTKGLHGKKSKTEELRFESLTGNKVNASSLEHNNMVPFFGSKVTQSSDVKGYEGLLNIYTGSGNNSVKKQGIAPMFKPEAGLTHIYGAPNTSDYIQDRMKDSLTSKMNNVKPWQEIQVGPGLGKGYSSKGSGGFNSGMEQRSKYMPKTVDQLRASTNPKVTYGGQVLGAYSGDGLANSANKAMIGKVEKNRPDRHYVNSADRWLTTTGQEKAQTARSAVVLQPENRTTTTREYFGNATDREGEGTYQPGHYRGTHRQQLKSENVGAASDSGAWGATPQDYGKKGYKARTNARTFTSERSQPGIAGALVNALTAPLLDVLRPSRKENVIGNMRPMGNASGKAGVMNEPVWNPADTPVHTIREQTEGTKHMLMGGTDEANGYMIQNMNAVEQHRESTNCQTLNGYSAANGTARARVVDADYNARLNTSKQVVSRVDRYNIGNSSLTSHAQNVTTLSNTATKPAETYGNFSKQTPSMSTHGRVAGKNTRNSSIDCTRNNPAMVSAFNQNPYTQSLNSWA